MNGKVVVGYNGSEPSKEAVSWAASEADRRGAELLVVSCFDVPVTEPAWIDLAADLYELRYRRATDRLSLIAAQLRSDFASLTVATDAALGDPANAIASAAGPHDLIVLGASGQSGAAALFVGNTPRRLLRQNPCPVVIVRSAASRGRPDRIVVGIDGSLGSDRALAWAADQADLDGVELLVVHTWMYPYAPIGSSGSSARDLTKVDAECVLDRSVEAARERVGIPIKGRLVEDTAVSGLLGVVRDGDLLVLGSRGRGRVTAAVLGSVVSSLLDHCVIPVVVVGEPHGAGEYDR